jgi:hypothetical protein
MHNDLNSTDDNAGLTESCFVSMELQCACVRIKIFFDLTWSKQYNEYVNKVGLLYIQGLKQYPK